MNKTLRYDRAENGRDESEGSFSFPASEARRAFCGLSPITVYPPRTELFRQGLPALGVFCIHSGLVKLVNLTKEGNELIVGLRSSGWILGAAPVIAHKPHPVSTITLTRCELHYVAVGDFLRTAELSADFAWELIRLYSREVYEQISQLAGLGTMRARERFGYLLMQMIGPGEQGQARLTLPLKFEEIAHLVAVTPEHLSRLLRQMEKEEIIRRERGWIIVLDAHRLSKSSDLAEQMSPSANRQVDNCQEVA